MVSYKQLCYKIISLHDLQAMPEIEKESLATK